MYYYVVGFKDGEQHRLGCTDIKSVARDWAYFCMFNRGYDECAVCTEDGEVIDTYKKGH